MDLHHILGDGTSMHVLIDDLAKAMQGETLHRAFYYLMLEENEKFHTTRRYIEDEEVELPNPHYKESYYLEFEILNLGRGVDIVLYYNASRFTEETAARILTAYRDACLEVPAFAKKFDIMETNEKE